MKASKSEKQGKGVVSLRKTNAPVSGTLAADHGFLGHGKLIFSFLSVVIAISVAIYLQLKNAQEQSSNSTLILYQSSQKNVPASSEHASDSELLPLDEFVRRKANVKLVGAEMAPEYEFDVVKENPYINYLPGPPMGERRERAMGAKFRNFLNHTLTQWWDDGSDTGVFSGVIRADADSTTNTYTTHVFHFRRKDTNELVASFTMNDDNFLYVIGPDQEGDKQVLKSKRYQDTMKELQFMKEYHRKHGVPWLSYYPRPKPVVFMYPADFPGQTHRVRSFVGYFNSMNEQSQQPIDFEIQVVSTKPRVLLIPKLLSPYEVDFVMDAGKKTLRESKVGNGADGFKSTTRTSTNGWLRRKSSQVLDRIYYRFADVLGMTDEQLQDGPQGNVENLQFVEYLLGQKYDPHHDFGNTGKISQRFSTLLVYLNVPEQGGATSFPKAYDGQGIQIKPQAGDAVLFYSMLPDGNGDDLSIHSGMPVYEGTKYICNLWSWDPKLDY
uniref:Fe2OG dioxygenase domain-containing protein n=1 Tax=Aplanochytrium stocchinoi TaxID=215587 RepID=A0A7S3LIY1_9STRA|mmetsp:Transcript_10931/g.12525  ORF Transcript_10931/g.12525 Transcript_10931/m.12525 type:complete len:496 (-) Transcript_10931:62-1549(-)